MADLDVSILNHFSISILPDKWKDDFLSPFRHIELIFVVPHPVLPLKLLIDLLRLDQPLYLHTLNLFSLFCVTLFYNLLCNF